MISLRLDRLMALLICGALLVSPVPAQESPAKPKSKPESARRKNDSDARAASLQKLAKRLNVGPGSTIADIGAGRGRDTWVFADIVGDEGRVYAEEITKGNVQRIREEAESRDLQQVRAVLGDSDDPGLPDNTVDMAFMHHVYHHLAKPRDMLQGIWQALKPGGYFVVVDRRKGTLVDWVPRADREKKHYWIAETTVVREAREEGFLFVGFGEEQWHAKGEVFVLILQRPTKNGQCGRDPAPMPPVDPSMVSDLLPYYGELPKRIGLVALGGGRKLIEPLLEASQAEAIDIVLEEWATQKDERPEAPKGLEIPSVLTENGDPGLGPEKLDAVYFLDTYHLLFHGNVLVPAIGKRLKDDGRIYVLDRIAEDEMPHREASHRRMIAPETVKKEMAEYGFRVESSKVPYSPGRFLLVFRKAP